MGFVKIHVWPLAYIYIYTAAKSLQLCLTLCDPIDGSPLGSPVPGILQARTLEWVAVSFSNAWKWKVKVKSLSCVRLLTTPWTAAYQAPPSMGFSRQEYWSGVPLPSLVAQVVKRLPTMQETQFDPWVGKIPWRRKWQPTAVFLPGEYYGLRSLVGYSPWSHKELDTTEQLHSLTHSYIYVCVCVCVCVCV